MATLSLFAHPERDISVGFDALLADRVRPGGEPTRMHGDEHRQRGGRRTTASRVAPRPAPSRYAGRGTLRSHHAAGPAHLQRSDRTREPGGPRPAVVQVTTRT